MDLIYSRYLRLNGVDKICWKLSLGSFRCLIFFIGFYSLQICYHFHGSLCGNQKCIQRLVSFFGQLCWGKFWPLIIYEGDRWWWRIGVVCVEGTWRLLHYPVAQELWNMVCSLFRVHWVMTHGVVDLLDSWSGKFNGHKTKVLWSMIPHCLMWVIWRKRNKHTFEGNLRLIHELKFFFF